MRQITARASTVALCRARGATSHVQKAGCLSRAARIALCGTGLLLMFIFCRPASAEGKNKRMPRVAQDGT